MKMPATPKVPPNPHPQPQANLPHERSAEAVISSFDTDAGRGLTAGQVRERQGQFGPNLLHMEERVSWVRRLLAQFRDPQVYLLLAAAAVSLLVSVLERSPGISSEALIILAIIFLNATLGFVQEDRAERALALLRGMIPPEASVIRDGVLQRVPAKDLVPGDLLVLSDGDSIPADARLTQTKAFRTMEAALTGESLPVAKTTLPGDASAGIADQPNMVFAGTSVVAGHARAVVTATGMRTEFGKIAQLVHAADAQPTPLQQDLRVLSKRLSAVVVGIAAVVIVTLLAVHGVRDAGAVLNILLFGIALAVAATPEGLAAIITLVLAIGVQRMARRGAIVRKLPAVETLGSATVIASDKTGTMTRNEMTVRVLVTASGVTRVSGAGYAPEGELTDAEGGPLSREQGAEAGALLQAAVLVNNAQLRRTDGVWGIQGDPTEAALLSAAGKAHLDTVRIQTQFPRIAEAPFSSERKRMSTVHREAEARGYVVFSKGAPDLLLDRCTHEITAGKRRELTPLRRQEILSENARLAEGALRMLGVATRAVASDEPLDPENLDERTVESGLSFLGLIGMVDPPRPEVRAAVEQARAAGVRTLLITGDHPRTALAVAHELDIEKGDAVLSGAQLEQMPDSELVQAVRGFSVYARVSPEHKLRIVRALQDNQEIVAMTGDGVNDAPALKAAQIGIAMGITGTDVSKEAADLVLTDDNFATIVAAVEEGRIVFDNIRKFLWYLLSTNSGEVLTIFLGSLLLSRPGAHLLLPLSAAQILWINLVTDGAPALALGVDSAASDIMRRAPRGASEGVLNRRMLNGILLVAAVMAAGTLWVFFRGSTNAPDPRSQTLAFQTLILFQLFNALSARSATRSAFHGIFANRWLWGAILLSLGMQLLILTVPFLRTAFAISPLGWRDWAECAAVASSVLWAIEIRKYFVRRSMWKSAGA